MKNEQGFMRALKCRECGREYPLMATHVCEFDFGPLEVVYDYERIKHTLTVLVAGERYTLTSPELTSATVMLNGVELQPAPDGSIPLIQGQPFSRGTVRLAPASITFLTAPSAGNKNCRRR